MHADAQVYATHYRRYAPFDMSPTLTLVAPRVRRVTRPAD